MKTPKYLTKLGQIHELNEEERALLKNVTEKFAFRANEYYLSLIDWNDPDDPIRRIIIPNVDELDEWGRLDASDESAYTMVHGLQHKYGSTAVLLVTDVCGGYCRFCFRKRLFTDGFDEVTHDVTEGIRYIREHDELTNILVTGGDPLMLSTRRLEELVRQLQEIEHVRIIRIGTKMLAFNPYRILDDPSLLEMVERYSTAEKKIYIMTQFNHPRELTDVAVKAVHALIGAGAIIANQTPMIRGVNDDPETLSMLLKKLSFIGAIPYYIFQCRPTSGNKTFAIPVEETYQIFQRSFKGCSGLAKRARLIMSHSTGKIEIAGMTDEHIFFRYHQSPDPEQVGSFMVFKRNPDAYWFDDYHELVAEHLI
ncbi:MAG: KamA family radical SAM protein [Euryarchaeota archaeon]|nr:KamA family radical SAM protein [Euryarchaeota archaeon]